MTSPGTPREISEDVVYGKRPRRKRHPRHSWLYWRAPNPRIAPPKRPQVDRT